jgi:UDP-N-acetylglucosamine acyltransferase
MEIHPTAIIHPGAQIGPNVSVEPYAIIGDRVTIGEGTRIGAHSVIEGTTEIGPGCEFFPMCSIGFPPQDLKYKGEDTQLIIGHHNIFREYVTISRGTILGNGQTVIGNHNFCMANVHIAHDCLLGSHIIMGNAATLAGHVTIADHASIGAYSGVHQFCKVGAYGFVGGYSVVTKDVLPYSKTVSARNTSNYGVNAMGLERKGFTRESIGKIQEAYRILLKSKLNTSQALALLKERFRDCSEVRILIEFIEQSERGVIK